jgi:hypothetical protein
MIRCRVCGREYERQVPAASGEQGWVEDRAQESDMDGIDTLLEPGFLALAPAFDAGAQVPVVRAPVLIGR